ncbi:MAG: hypothetical protein H7A43_11405 [Verrucomicrobia bacterium]|nr:hypothetical protein [Verrucomicrobiota bacterium]
MARNLSIQTLLITLLGGAILSTAAGTGWVFYRNYHRSTYDLTQTFTENTTTLISELVASQLAIGTCVLQDLSEAMANGTLSDARPDELVRRFANALRHRQSLAWISYSRAEDGAYFGVWRNAQDEMIYNRSHPEQNHGIPEEFRIDAEGNQQPYQGNVLPPYDPRERPWYETAVQSSNLVWTDVYTFHEGRLGVSCVTSLTENGQLRGVLTIDFFLENLSLILGDIHAPADGLVFLFYRHQSVIPPAGISPVQSRVIESIAEQLPQAPDPDRDAYQEYLVEGTPYIVSYRYLSLPRNPGWSCAVVMPREVLLHDVHQATHRALAITGLMLLSAFVITSFVAHRLTRPLRKIAGELNRIGHGVFNGEPNREASGIREFQALNRCLYQLRNNLTERDEQRKRILQAEQANEDKAEFAAMISHEIRTPLQTLVGYNELLAAQEGSEAERATYLRALSDGTTQLLRLLNNLLDLFKLEAGKLRPYPAEIDVSDLVRTSASSCRHQVERKGLSLIIDTPDRPALHGTDALMLQQIVVNLISNAAKFTPAGSVTVRLESKPSGFTLSVSDTGIGMTASEMQEIFERYRQAHDSIRTQYGGTGLGLTICKRFTELLGGQLSVQSEPGVGTEITITFPSMPSEGISDDKPCTV